MCAYSHIIHVFVYIEDCMQIGVCPVLVLMEWRLCMSATLQTCML